MNKINEQLTTITQKLSHFHQGSRMHIKANNFQNTWDAVFYFFPWQLRSIILTRFSLTLSSGTTYKLIIAYFFVVFILKTKT